MPPKNPNNLHCIRDKNKLRQSKFNPKLFSPYILSPCFFHIKVIATNAVPSSDFVFT